MAWSGFVQSYVYANDPGAIATSGGASKNRTVEAYGGNARSGLANGNGAAQIDLAWYSETTYSTGGTTHDLSALTDAATNTGAATFSSIKYLGIWNADSTNTIVVGNAASNPFTPGFSAATTTFTIQPLGHAVFYNPTATGWTTSSASNLKIVAGAATPTAAIVLLGED